jgi:hypothetical protein
VCAKVRGESGGPGASHLNAVAATAAGSSARRKSAGENAADRTEKPEDGVEDVLLDAGQVQQPLDVLTQWPLHEVKRVNGSKASLSSVTAWS